jgi:hypothetical protein
MSDNYKEGEVTFITQRYIFLANDIYLPPILFNILK